MNPGHFLEQWFGRRRSLSPDVIVSVIDLVVVVVGAGGTPRRALDLVAARGPIEVAVPLSELMANTRAGWSTRDVLIALPEILGDDLRPLAAALLSAERDGAPIGVLLGRLADEARAVRRRRDQEQADRLAVHLLVPLALCSLPAVVVGVIVPLAVALLAGV